MYTPIEAAMWRPQIMTVDHVRALDGELCRVRNAVFPQGYFVDLPWQLILDLDNAARDGRAFPFSGEGYAMPVATLYRLRQFEADGYVERRVDPVDPTHELAVLTPKARALLNEVFEQTAMNFTKGGR